MEILSYILSILGLISMVTASLIKGENMKGILILVFLGNMLVATSYCFEAAWNGALSCFVGAAQTFLNYFFESKNKKLPMLMVGIYAGAFVVVNVAPYITNIVALFTSFGIVALIASLTFIMCIGQKSGTKYRIWSIINMVLWALYDLLSGAYAPLVTHAIMLASNIIGLLIHDVKNTKKTA